jgi:hypothetical protein
MTKNPDRLYELLPVIYRQRDVAQGYPLQALLRVITEQVNVVEADMDQLYENWFIETCQDWVVPYIGDLIGYQPVHEAGEPGEVSTAQGSQRNKILVSRQEVANTIRYRRRKGTLALLELLAHDVAGWPARAVEFYRLLGRTQGLNHVRLAHGRTADLRLGNMLDLQGTPFTDLAHTVDVRRVNSPRRSGWPAINGVGLFVWRLKSYSVTETPAYCLEQVGPHVYTFSALGNDTPLYNRPQPEPEPTHIAEPLNLPIPIRRRPFEERVERDGKKVTQASADYYGADRSLLIWAADWPRKGAAQPLANSQILPADLSDWQYTVPRNFVAVDPELGRILFPANQLPKQGVRVSYHYAFSADMGGGEYNRVLSQPAGAVVYPVRGKDELQKALAAWDENSPAFENQPAQAVIEIMDSGVYTLPIRIHLKAEHDLQLRAANGTRPIIRLLDYMADRPDAFTVTGEAGSRFTLDGLLINGRSLQILGPEIDPEAPLDAHPVEDLCRLTIRHTTLVPGWMLDNNCEPRRPNEPSLELINTGAHVHIERSILGTIQVTADQVRTDPITIHLSDSILDATGSDCDSPACEALGAPGWPLAHAVLTVLRSTVIGKVFAHAIDLAENSIFMSRVRVGRRQRGCMRFCYVAPGSRTPRRYQCQPDLVEQIVMATVPEGPERDQAKEREQLRVWPQFNSTRYGTPTYCQLALTCAPEIRRGADDESEMGAFHDLYQPQREANLRARLDEYNPAGMDAGLIFAS